MGYTFSSWQNWGWITNRSKLLSIRYTKKRADTLLRASFYTVMSENAECSNWYLLFNDEHCTDPAPHSHKHAPATVSPSVKRVCCSSSPHRLLLWNKQWRFSPGINNWSLCIFKTLFYNKFRCYRNFSLERTYDNDICDWGDLSKVLELTSESCSYRTPNLAVICFFFSSALFSFLLLWSSIVSALWQNWGMPVLLWCWLQLGRIGEIVWYCWFVGLLLLCIPNSFPM